MFGSSLYFATKVSVVVSFVFFILGWLFPGDGEADAVLSIFGGIFSYSGIAVMVFSSSFYFKFFKPNYEKELLGIQIVGKTDNQNLLYFIFFNPITLFFLSFIFLYLQYIYLKKSSPLVFILDNAFFDYLTLMLTSLFYFFQLGSALFFDSYLLKSMNNNTEMAYKIIIAKNDYIYRDYTILNVLDKDHRIDSIVLFTNILIHTCLGFLIASICQLVKASYKNYEKDRDDI